MQPSWCCSGSAAAGISYSQTVLPSGASHCVWPSAGFSYLGAAKARRQSPAKKRAAWRQGAAHQHRPLLVSTFWSTHLAIEEVAFKQGQHKSARKPRVVKAKSK